MRFPKQVNEFVILQLDLNTYCNQFFLLYIRKLSNYFFFIYYTLYIKYIFIYLLYIGKLSMGHVYNSNITVGLLT